MRLHVVGLPWNYADEERFSTCAYGTKTIRWAEMMTQRGHEVYLYWGQPTGAICTEEIEVITPEQQADILGTTDAPWNTDHPAWITLNTRATIEILKRAQPRDFLCLITAAQKPIADNLPMMPAVEFGVGYAGIFSPFAIFESYAWMHTVNAAREGADWDLRWNGGHWFQEVCPNFYRADDFHVSAPDDPYFLFVGRGISRKGVQIAADVCEHLGARLIFAGQEIEGWPTYGDKIGPVGPKQRAELMSGATALFAPTTYCGPFEGVSVEALLSGCPVICTDAGAFTENILDGDGWRCRTMAEFVDAARAAQAEAASTPSDPPYQRSERRQRAVDRFTFDAVAPRFERYFDRLAGLWGEGWTAMERDF